MSKRLAATAEDRSRLVPAPGASPAWLTLWCAASLVLGVTSAASPRAVASAHGPGARRTCGWRVAPFPKLVPKNAKLNGLPSISQPPRGGAWATAGRVDRNADSHDMVLHWNGRRWSPVPRPDGKSSLGDVLAISRHDVWFAGQGAGGYGHVLIEHWNGKRISVVRNHLGTSTITQLAGVQDDSVWLLSDAGDQSRLAHWNGSTWSEVQPPNFGGDPVEGISAGSRKDLWAVGGYVGGPGDVAHWNGARWHYVNDPVFARLGSAMSAVLDLGQRDIWTAGNNHVAHFNGKKWSVTPGPAPNPRNWALFPAIRGVRSGLLYAAGSTRRARGLILRWTGNRWIDAHAPVPNKRSSDFDSLGVSASGEVWAAGETFQRLSDSFARARTLIDHYVPCR